MLKQGSSINRRKANQERHASRKHSFIRVLIKVILITLSTGNLQIFT